LSDLSIVFPDGFGIFTGLFVWVWVAAGYVTGVCRVVVGGFGCRRFRSTRFGLCLFWALGEGDVGPDLVFFGSVLR
jgi:hypothetical protein